MLLNDVVMGKAIKLTRTDTSLTKVRRLDFLKGSLGLTLGITTATAGVRFGDW
jgi:hypothetical protein